MALLGTGVPTFYLPEDGVTVSLPVPAERKEWPQLVQKVYTNINDELLLVKKGYRVVLEMEFTQVSSSTYEDIIKIADADIVMLKFQGVPFSYQVFVTVLKGGREGNNRDVDTITIAVTSKYLIKKLPNPDEYYLVRHVFSGAIYLPEPEDNSNP